MVKYCFYGFRVLLFIPEPRSRHLPRFRSGACAPALGQFADCRWRHRQPARQHPAADSQIVNRQRTNDRAPADRRPLLTFAVQAGCRQAQFLRHLKHRLHDPPAARNALIAHGLPIIAAHRLDGALPRRCGQARRQKCQYFTIVPYFPVAAASSTQRIPPPDAKACSRFAGNSFPCLLMFTCLHLLAFEVFPVTEDFSRIDHRNPSPGCQTLAPCANHDSLRPG